MQLTPRYGEDPIITLDGLPAAIAEPLTRQRHRLAQELASFTAEEWSHPSRCAGWSNRDVITHLDSTNTFWNFSIAMARKGEPTQFLATFDPVASPAQLVTDAPPISTEALLEQFGASNQSLADQLHSLEDHEWSLRSEAPPGHVSITTLAHHALWDSLVHERDILIPLHRELTEEPDETLASLRYVAALSPAFALSRGTGRPAVLGVEPTDLDEAFRVIVTDHVDVQAGRGDVPDAVLSAPAAVLLDALSLRRRLPGTISPDDVWLVDGLAVTFDQPFTQD